MTTSTQDTVDEFVARVTTDDEDSVLLQVALLVEFDKGDADRKEEMFADLLNQAATSAACVLGLFEYLVAPGLAADGETEVEVEGIEGVAAEVLRWGLDHVTAPAVTTVGVEKLDTTVDL